MKSFLIEFVLHRIISVKNKLKKHESARKCPGAEQLWIGNFAKWGSTFPKGSEPLVNPKFLSHYDVISGNLIYCKLD